MERSMEVSKKTKYTVPYNPAIPLLGIHPKEHESAFNRDTYIFCTLFTIANL
jgi:hypothetical protein